MEHPDPVPLAVLPRIDRTGAERADSNAGSGCGQRLGGAEDDRAQVDGDGGREVHQQGPRSLLTGLIRRRQDGLKG